MTSNSYRTVLIGTTSALAIALTTAAPAFAQEEDQAAEAEIGLEEITVTARRVEENIQRVPIAIQAFTPETLAKQDIRDIWTMTKNIGGLNICCSPGSTSFIFMRGIGNGTPTYFADVPKASTGFSNAFDIANVQVLKGPQGTLFGEASNAGALVYQPKLPGEVFGGYVGTSAGNYGRVSVEAGIDIPIIEDRVLFRIAATRFNREGYIQNITNGQNYGEHKYYIIRPSLTVRFTEDIESTTVFEYVKSNGNPAIFTLDDINFGFTNGAVFGQAFGNGFIAFIPGIGPIPNMPAFDAARDKLLSEELALGKYKVNGLSTACATPLGPLTRNGGCFRNFTRDIFIANTTTWNVTDNFTIKNIFGYATQRAFSQPGDTDGTRMDLFDGGSPKNNKPYNSGPTVSEELQFLFTDIAGMVDLQVGTFHRHEHNEPRIVHGNAFGIAPSANIDKTSSRSRAIYAQGNIDLGQFVEGLSLTVGARQSWETIGSQRWILNPATEVQRAMTGGPGTAAGVGKFSNLSYTAQIQYQLNDDVLFFINNSRGFGAGGLQNVYKQETYAPDILNNLEIGTKSTFYVGDTLVRANASWYYGWFSNVKVNSTKLAYTDAFDTTPGLIVVTENAATARITGAEADVTVVPTDWLEIGTNVAYTDAKYTVFNQLDPITGVVSTLTSTPFSFTPKWKWSVRATYNFPMDSSNGDMSLTANLTHTGVLYNVAKPRIPTDPTDPNTGIVCDKYRTAANGYGPLSADGGKVRVIDCNPSYYNLDMTLNWDDIMGYSGVSGSVFVTNVTKNMQNDGGCYCNVALGLTSQMPQVPRMFGIRLRYDF